MHRQIPGRICRATITKSKSCRYFVSILVETKYKPLPKTGKQIGLDLGIKTLVTTSDGDLFENHKFSNKYARQLRKVQQHLSRKKIGSNSRNKQKVKVAKLHAKVANCRQDNLHKISYKLVKENDLIIIENLNIKGMIKNKKLARSIVDASWGTFIRFLDYKCKFNNKELIKIDRFFASSKICYSCGFKNKVLKLSQRQWNCTSCNSDLDRDINAAKNILREGLNNRAAKPLNNLSVGTTDYSNREIISPSAHTEPMASFKEVIKVPFPGLNNI